MYFETVGVHSLCGLPNREAGAGGNLQDLRPRDACFGHGIPEQVLRRRDSAEPAIDVLQVAQGRSDFCRCSGILIE
jgi:hypothetical protein